MRGRAAVAGGIGAVAGFLSGLFGVGGGILIVPGLVLLLRMDQRRAHGTSLAAIIPIALAGLAGYAVDGAVDWPVSALLATGATAGAAVGTTYLRRLPERTLRLSFAAFVLVAAAVLFLHVPEPGGRAALDAARGMGLVGIGLAAGILAGLLGVGGGIILVPALVLLYSVPDAAAKGTSLAVILPTAVVGTARNLRHGLVDLPYGAVIGVVGVATGFTGARLAAGLDPRISETLFAVLLVAVAARLAWRP